MAKRRKNSSLNSKAIQTITACRKKYGTTKHGLVKGKNKKETKILRQTCCHHTIGGKNGDKLKAKVFTQTDPVTHKNVQICSLCGTTMDATNISNSEIKEIANRALDINEAMKFYAVAVGADHDTIDDCAQDSIRIRRWKKRSLRINTIARKSSEIKRKKKEDKSSADFGSWAHKR